VKTFRQKTVSNWDNVIDDLMADLSSI